MPDPTESQRESQRIELNLCQPELTVRWVNGLTGVSAQSLAMEESDPEAEMSSSTRCTRVFPVQTELRLKSATQNIVQVGMKTFETEKNLSYSKLNDAIYFS